MCWMDYILRMNVEHFDLNLLRVLDALLTEHAVGRAAVRLGLSQPAASHALRRLRNLLNDPLLVRVGSRMELTPRAFSLREPVDQALAAARKLFEGTEFNPATSRRRFVLMAPDIVVSLIAPALTESVTREAPNVCVEITPWRGPNLTTEDFLRTLDAIVTNLGDSFPASIGRRFIATLMCWLSGAIIRWTASEGRRIPRSEAYRRRRSWRVFGSDRRLARDLGRSPKHRDRRPELSPAAAHCSRNRPCRVCPEQARKPAGSPSETDDGHAAVQSRN